MTTLEITYHFTESREDTDTKRQISKGHSLGNTYVWVVQIQGVHINVIMT